MRFYKEYKINGEMISVGDLLQVGNRNFFIVAISSHIKILEGSFMNDKRPMFWNLESDLMRIYDEWDKIKEVEEIIKTKDRMTIIDKKGYHYLSTIELETKLPQMQHKIIKQPTKEMIKRMSIADAI